ncbi:phage shock protein A (PspA) family protein [Salinimicrobium sediminis]|uniref:Phage shock protein A (PspA) family protein n=1 Tax=Salinimicrobium sediminis TaxID=1343891 RepID=A0A285X2Q0_9FLAO|nr:PspA/IM30 family protein [Salinimicrobium sediminis]MDX1753239.1 PspA/IM30 family protein [Salinimicrobium sediminis]SOC79617.1 phage shock protein A (PspA) family protein [Salinimicrobium sediminis]
MNVFKRLFKIGQAETNSAIDNMEDPIKMTEQGIRDMKQDLDKSLEALAQVKALAIRAKNDQDEYQNKAEEYQNKAIIILKKGHSKEIDATEADRLAKEALVQKEAAEQQVLKSKEESDKFDNNVAQLQKTIQTIKGNIGKWENELKTLKARVKVSNATKSLNKQMAEIDSTGTVSMLERMKEKVAREEALAEAYGDIANAKKSIDDEIDKAADTSTAKANDDLAKLKEKLGLNDSKEA